jgi:hypothetical protein
MQRSPSVVDRRGARSSRTFARACSHLSVIGSGDRGEEPHINKMAPSSTRLQADAAQPAVSLARWDDEGGSPKPRPDMTSCKIYGISQSWFVSPIVVPAFFIALIFVGAVYQRLW